MRTIACAILLLLACAPEAAAHGRARSPARGHVQAQARVQHAPRPVVSAFQRDVECLALAIYHEARGEGRRGREAVAHVVVNRMEAKGRDRRACSVVYERRGRGMPQFPWTARGWRSNAPREAEPWGEARAMAVQFLSDRPPDFTRGATHFYAPSLARPSWARMGPQMRVGGQIFVVENDRR